MHATIGEMKLSFPNRKGRKRKMGRRTASGKLAEVRLDFQGMAALQPHRVGLPAALRCSEKAGTVLGGLNLLGRISDHQYEAGRRYSVIVGAYLSMAGAPKGTAGGGKGEICIGSSDCPPDTCICRARTDRYMRAYEAISLVGRRCHLVVNAVAIDDQPVYPYQMETLKLGLTALAGHFGLTNHRK